VGFNPAEALAAHKMMEDRCGIEPPAAGLVLA
jgi:hypothetical protein